MIISVERIGRDYIAGAWGDTGAGRYAPDLDLPNCISVTARIARSNAAEVNAAGGFFTQSKTVYVDWS